MLTFATKYGLNETSQNGENGIITECLQRICPELTVAVEFGAPDKKFCSNIYPLGDAGWTLHYYSDQPSEGVEQKFITPQNVNDLPACSVLSVDIDGNDYSVWKAYNSTPDIVVIEINSSLAPGITWLIGDPKLGTAYTPMVELAISKGYFLLCHTGNCVFVLNKYRHLFPEIIGDGLTNPDLYFNTNWL